MSTYTVSLFRLRLNTSNARVCCGQGRAQLLTGVLNPISPVLGADLASVKKLRHEIDNMDGSLFRVQDTWTAWCGAGFPDMNLESRSYTGISCLSPVHWYVYICVCVCVYDAIIERYCGR